MEYQIQFQNTGNDTAYYVRISNNIPEELDLPTLEIIDVSHPIEINYIPSARLLNFEFINRIIKHIDRLSVRGVRLSG